MTQSVVYTRKGDVHTFELGVSGLESLTIDYAGVPNEERNGLAKQLMASSALSCYGAMLGAALEARGAKFTSIRGKATSVMGKNDTGHGRVKELILEFTVHLPTEYEKIFERCIKIMKKGCLLTGSLHEGIEMKYDLQPVFES